jgi:hypothetical protein
MPLLNYISQPTLPDHQQNGPMIRVTADIPSERQAPHLHIDQTDPTKIPGIRKSGLLPARPEEVPVREDSRKTTESTFDIDTDTDTDTDRCLHDDDCGPGQFTPCDPALRHCLDTLASVSVVDIGGFVRVPLQ